MGNSCNIDNNKLANLICSNKFATRQQIIALWSYITPDRDIGILLVESGLLPPDVYSKMVTYLNQTAPVQSNPATANVVESKVSVSVQPPAADSIATSKAQKTIPSTRNTVSIKESSAQSGNISTFSSINDLLSYARSIDASDLHLSPNNPVIVRKYGKLQSVTKELLDAEMMQSKVQALLTNEQLDIFDKQGDLECIKSLDGAGRFRVTVLKQRGGWDITARCIPDRIRSFEETGMPPACKALTQWAQGLVLITGPASCGKSSTLATLVEMINQSRTDHIITLESPIEYVYTSARSQITQRELGKDTCNQEAALRAALREDPDIIVVGELRDLAAIQLAVSAAETGHLVFGTMNTICASRTIYRLIDSFPPEEQSIIRNMVSESLRGVISQQLVPRINGDGLVAAYEVLLVNPAVSNMIRKDEAHQLGSAMITGKASGMQLLDDSLRALVNNGTISQQEAASRFVSRLPGEK